MTGSLSSTRYASGPDLYGNRSKMLGAFRHAHAGQCTGYIHTSTGQVTRCRTNDSLTVSATSLVENQQVLFSGHRLLLAGEFDSRHLGRADLSSPLSDLTVMYGAILNPNYTRISSHTL